jgi:hypothetical protein
MQWSPRMRARPFAARFALVSALTIPARAALADEAPSSTPAAAAPQATVAPSTHTVWYGWQVLLADASVVGLTAAGANSSTPGASGLLWFALVGYLADGPVIHAAHSQYVAAGLSGGMRLVFPVVGALIGGSATSCSAAQADGWGGCDFVKLGGAAVGLLGGMLTASIVDVTALAWERPGAPDGAARGNEAGPWVLPSVATTTDSEHRRVVSVGVAGVF